MKPDYPALDFPPLEEDAVFVRQGLWYVRDPFRRKSVRLTPEEWVRQHLARYLVAAGYPQGLIAVEKAIRVGSRTQRFDIVVFDRHNRPFMLVECKRPEQKLTPDTLNQAARYNTVLGAPYLMISNGRKHYLCRVHPDGRTEFLKKLPRFA